MKEIWSQLVEIEPLFWFGIASVLFCVFCGWIVILALERAEKRDQKNR